MDTKFSRWEIYYGALQDFIRKTKMNNFCISS
ncbi:hypothetical protein ACJIZ3_019117 [Penstemon smallii]|uniref:Maturase K n=1 Tax=Penstemon smallii TaxID=265156 RepID=A0ABD3T0A9_9LAMI